MEGSYVQRWSSNTGGSWVIPFANHVTRTRCAHQVTAASLHILMNKAYNEYQAKSRENEQENMFSKEEWKDEMAKKSPQFQNWSSLLTLEVICLRLIRAFQKGGFPTYIDALRAILPWMFVMDHSNYASWLSVHYRDMYVLPFTHQGTYRYFSQGYFAVHKITELFSVIAFDHAHEQESAKVKGEGGTVCLTENPSALRRWMVEVLSSPGWFKSSKLVTIQQRKMTIMSRSQVPRVHSARRYWILYLHFKNFAARS